MTFLKALSCENQERPPIWLMRQAGRYLPEYRTLRQKYSLWELFHQPELAAEITKLPVQILDVDAAILFSDILVISEVFGLKVHFPETGAPFIEPALRTRKDVEALVQRPVEEVLHYVSETISILQPTLKVPLIGFCAGPFTLATYLINQGGKEEGRIIKEWIDKDKESFHLLLEKIKKVSIEYLLFQVKAGVDAVQIFDSWANLLSYPHFLEFSLQYLRQMIAVVKEKGVPVIVFCRGSCSVPKELAEIGPSAISFDWQKPIRELRQQVPSNIAVQGNINPDLLKESPDIVERAVKQLLEEMKGEKGFIVNLGHGVPPDARMESVERLVDLVKNVTT